MKKEYRVTVLETRDSTEYLVDKIIESKDKPYTISKRYLKKYPLVYEIEVSLVERNTYELHN